MGCIRGKTYCTAAFICGYFILFLTVYSAATVPVCPKLEQKKIREEYQAKLESELRASGLALTLSVSIAHENIHLTFSLFVILDK